MKARAQTRARALLISATALLVACSGDAGTDAGPDAVDAGPGDAGTDAGPQDAGPPPRSVPAEGWANSVVDSDVLETLEYMGMMWTNVSGDPDFIIGEPDGDSVAMGDTGHYVTIDFGAGEEAFDGPGDDIIVRERDLFTGGAPEPYTVAVANDPAGPFTELGAASGSGEFDLADISMASVRYVRVTSTSTADDIVNGLGSPEYPGAEIDAVGTYNPGSVPP